MHLYHDSQVSLCRQPRGAAVCNSPVVLRLHAGDSIRSACLRFYDGSEKWLPMEKEKDGWFSVQVRLPSVPILCWYDFRAEDQDGEIHAYGCPEDGMGGEGILAATPRAWQITVYDAA